MLLGDVKDDVGCTAVFSEQGQAASPLTAAEVLDTISITRNGWSSNRCRYCFYTASVKADSDKINDPSVLFGELHIYRYLFHMPIIWQVYCGSANWKNNDCKKIGKRQFWECLYFHRKKPCHPCQRMMTSQRMSQRKLSSQIKQSCEKIATFEDH